jgi:hypothetical protein
VKFVLFYLFYHPLGQALASMSNSWHKVKRPAKQTLLSQKENESTVDVAEKTASASEGGRKQQPSMAAKHNATRQPLMAVKHNATRQPPRLQRPKPLDLKQSMLSVTKEKSKENRITSPTYDHAYMTMVPEKRNRLQQDGSILTTVGAKSVRQTIDRKALVHRLQEKPSSQRQNAKGSQLAIGRDNDIQYQDGGVRQVRRKASENKTQHLSDFKIEVVSKQAEIRREEEEVIFPHMKCSSSKASYVDEGEDIATPRSTSITYSHGEHEIPKGLLLTKEDISSTGDGKLKKLKSEQDKKTEMQEGQLYSKQTASNIVSKFLEDEAASPSSSPTKRVVGSVESSQLLSSSPSIDEPPTSSTDLLSPDVQYEVHTTYPNPTGRTLTEKLGIGM